MVSSFRRRTAIALVAATALAALGCSSDLRRFPLRAPMLRDTDTTPVTVACHADPKHPERKLCMPEAYESSFAWDAADNTLFRPLAKTFAVEPGGEAVNVNSFDEVPDSSWFENRIGARATSLEEVRRGFCGDTAIDPNDPDGSWVIDQGKMNGANPGFRIKDAKGVRYMLKPDTKEEPERATGATAIATRIYYAAGFWAPCDSVVYVRRPLLKLSPGLTITDNTGKTRTLDEHELTRMLSAASLRGDRMRFVASRWLPGRPIGPFRYEGVREDDPNDVIPHEDRRDLRGARLIAAWLNHFDSREQNSMDTWMASDPEKPESSPGHVRHWYLDLGDCFGSQWSWDEISRRLGHAYYLDFGYIAADFVTLGAIERPWDRAERHGRFGYFSARDFDPEQWRGGYPNPTFARMTEHDGAWMARILARFTPAHVATAVQVGDYTDPADTAFLTDQLVLRRRAILRRYLARLSPLAAPTVEPGGELCVTDLARTSGVFPEVQFRYSAAAFTGASLDAARVNVSLREDRPCVTLLDRAPDGGARDAAPSRYVVIDIQNGQASGPLRVHLYDLGRRRGLRVVGIERPGSPGL